MKRIVKLMASAMALSLLCACTPQNVPPTSTPTNEQTQTQTQGPTVQPTPYIDEANAVFADAVNGNDANEGTKNAPVATVQRAMQLAGEGKTVYLAQGTYYGTVDVKDGVTLTSMPGQRAMVTPTVSFSGQWSKYKDNIYCADVSAIFDSINTERFQLFADGDSLVEARYPNMEPSMKNAITYERAVSQVGTCGTMVVTKDELPADISGARVVIWPGSDGASAWDNLSSTIAAVDGCCLTLSEEIGQDEEYTGLNAYHPVDGNAYFVVGALALLDAPGEYYLDVAGKTVYLYMPDGSNPANHAISFRGSNIAINGKDCKNATVSNIDVFGGGVYFKNTENCKLLGCKVIFADHANFIKHCYSTESSTYISGKNNTVSQCEIGYTAFSGITVGGDNNKITDNYIHDCDYIGSGFAGIYVEKSDGLDISYNSIRNSGRIHIYFVTRTEFGKCTISHNLFENHSCLTSDCGAFYTWSTDGGGTEIFNNMVLCTTLNTNGALSKYYEGLYLDNYCSGFAVHHNIVKGGGAGLRTNLWCKNTIYANNTVIGSDCGYGLYGYPQDEADCSTVQFYNNLFVGIKKAVVNYYASEDGKEASYYGSLSYGKVPVTKNLEHRLQSGNNYVEAKLNDDCTLREGSAMIDKGVVLEGITDGFTGEAPDVGAIEYGSQVFDYGPTWQLN